MTFIKKRPEKVGNLLAKKGIRLVYGGGNMGLMGVLSNSAINSGGDVYGVITNHLIEIEKRNDSLNNIKIVETMHERKIEMYNNADAFLIFPGGIGTLEEFLKSIHGNSSDFIKNPSLFITLTIFGEIFLLF